MAHVILPQGIEQKNIEPLLTIAIPTYNRFHEIVKQVQLVLPQLNPEVRLIVYDNCSDKNISDLFSDSELELFTIVRNPVNVGADANIARCFENCDTKWLWTLSDDDFIKTDAIIIVLNTLKNNDNLTFINFCPTISFTTSSFEEFIVHFKNHTVYSSSFTMSSCVYNMKLLKKSLIDYYEYLSSMVGTIILVLKYIQRTDGAKCKFFDYTPIECYNNEVGWDYTKYIKRSTLFRDAFYEKKYYKNLLVGYFKTNYLLILQNRNKRKISIKERWNLFFFNLKAQGLLNAFFFSPKIIVHLFIKLSLQTFSK